jgi:twitching motility protein PilT
MDPVDREQLDALLAAMIQTSDGASDLLFVAGKPPQVEVYGKLTPFHLEPPASILTSELVESLAVTIINGNQRLLDDLATTGSCDCSYSVPNFCRFRVNIFRQNGNYAMVLRKLQSQIPTLERLGLPPIFKEAIKEKTGITFVTGATGSGKTTTLAAMLNEINQTSDVHIVTLEDPIEFLHPHLRSTFSQRELGRDFYDFSKGLRAALRQAPKIILVGEIRDRETMEVALTAAETGHMVYSTLHTISAGQTIQRVLGMFDKEEEPQVRERLSETIRYVVSQRLVAKKAGGRLLVTEIMGSSLRTREAIAMGENENRKLFEIIEAGTTSGWHSFEQSLMLGFEADLITEETAVLYSTNKSRMRQRIDAFNKQKEPFTSQSTIRMRQQKGEPVLRLKLDHAEPSAPAPDLFVTICPRCKSPSKWPLDRFDQMVECPECHAKLLARPAPVS